MLCCSLFIFHVNVLFNTITVFAIRVKMTGSQYLEMDHFCGLAFIEKNSGLMAAPLYFDTGHLVNQPLAIMSV